MRLVNFLQDSVNDKCILKGCFICGSPGSGKSYVIQKIGLGNIWPRLINTDKWTEHFGNGKNVDWDVYGNRITKLTSQDVFNYLNSMLPLFIDSTSANFQNTVNRKMLLEELGYDTGCIFVNTDFETAIKRNRDRKRHVPEEFLKQTFLKVQQVKKLYKAGFKYYKEIRNNDGELTDQVILDAFNSATNFFEAPIQNPVGNKIIEQLRETGGKYLIDLPEFKDLKSRCSVWWRN